MNIILAIPGFIVALIAIISYIIKNNYIKLEKEKIIKEKKVLEFECDKYKKLINEYRKGLENLLLGNYEEALKYFITQKGNNLDDINDIIIAKTYEYMNDMEKALIQINHILEKIPNDDLLYSYRGKIYYEMNDYVKSQKDHEYSIFINKDNNYSQNQLGSIYFIKKEYLKAKNIYEILLQNMYDKIPYKKLIELCNIMIKEKNNKIKGKSNREKIIIFDNIIEALEKKDLSLCISILSTYSSKYGYDYDYYKFEGYFHLVNRKVLLALKAFQNSENILKNDVLMLNLIGNCFFIKNDYDSAISFYLKAINVSNNKEKIVSLKNYFSTCLFKYYHFWQKNISEEEREKTIQFVKIIQKYEKIFSSEKEKDLYLEKVIYYCKEIIFNLNDKLHISPDEIFISHIDQSINELLYSSYKEDFKNIIRTKIFY